MYRCDPSDHNNEAIRSAAKNGHLNIVKFLYLRELRNNDGISGQSE